ncbi:chitin deacetylase 1 isoform X1 [Frieseomelitta varia]|uniref:chitin deacetylase 1 isoform X1 n=1 Tax=Frieseomelitta varia TaxID=561572 RepID=UPI001CB6B351|nr:chitin deacetylase 1 isoform X1 [Frieseomelitta varia]
MKAVTAYNENEASRKTRSEYSSYKALGSGGRCQLESASTRTKNEKQNGSNMKSKLRCLCLPVIFFLASTSLGKETPEDTPCIDDNKFYRNPNAPTRNIWSPVECAKYYLCLDNEVFEFRCSQGLLFDVSRQVCDFKANVDNCDVMSESQPPRPLLEDGDCGEKHLACGDGTCFPATYFCDGSVDCPDGSDEAYCDVQDDPNGAVSCNPEECRLPNCWCSSDGTQVPGNLTASMVPQMITVTFDDAVNAENFELFSKIFLNDKKNPNGCPARGTFYVSHQYTNYRDVQYLWNIGHEIAAHSVTHRGPEEWWSRNATIEDWFDEMVGVANIINKYAAVRLEDIKGLRAPFLRTGWNRQFLMMSEFGFVYDSSMVAPFSNLPVWPYTLDYRPPHSCVARQQLCPTRAYPGVWELPINQLLAGQYTCARMDSCPSDLSGEDVYKILTLNFKRHYLSNRAPLGLHFHASWFQNPSYFYAFSKFMDDVLRLNDVYFVTSYQVIEWMRKPTSLNAIETFKPWQCNSRIFQPFEFACDLPNSCKLPSRVLKSYRYLHTCFECPKEYPWLRNEFGTE